MYISIHQGRWQGPLRSVIWAAWLFLIAVPLAAAETPDILIVSSSDAELYQRFQAAYRTAIESAESSGDKVLQRMVVLEDGLLERDRISNHTNLIVTIGSRAARAVSALDTDIPVLNTVIPESVYQSLNSRQNTCARQSAIFIDQPISRQVELARLIFPQLEEYGLLLGPVSIRRQPEIETMKKASGHRLTVMVVDRDGSTMATGRDLLAQTDLLLAVNDPLVLSRENAKWLLYAAYQQQLPVIGFSSAYVKAGAAASVFSEPEQLARQAVELTRRWQRNGTGCLPPPEFPRYFNVAINRAVVQSLGGVINDEDMLTELILDKEQP